MKFIVSRDVLYKNLSAISGVLGTNSTLPILDNFLFSVEGDLLTLTASDLDATMTATVQLTYVEGEGAVAIPSKTILETLKLMPETPVTFDIDIENHIIKFSTENGEYDSSCFPGEEYPAMKTMNEPQSFEIEAVILQRAISKTLFATGNDELRPNMMGVLCELSNENITFVATDAHKLVRYTNNAVKVDDSAAFILPKKPITQLKSTLSGVNDKVKVEYTADTHHIRFSFANIVLFSSLKEGKFPAYQAVIPKDNPNKFVVDRKDFHKSICRVGIYSNQSTFQVRISLSDEKKVVTAEDLDFSNKAEEVIKGSYIGETMDIGFNSKFLREMLENLDSETISLEMSQPNRAALIVPTEQDSPDEDLLMLIMPVMLNY
ncbi:MAG: DNA polymerase III subunit beta [Bacteroidetes bacterium]|nr:DNA polymerase III subunit beta [Bacteroidota bacterium]MCL1968131.1 DNA polymerase III subunit beta [Bacteroidota bacterium]